MRLQLALNVRNLDQAIDFYSKMFGAEVNKRKPGYANFSIDQPPLKLVLFEDPNAAERLNHLGVEVFDSQQVEDATNRFGASELSYQTQEKTTCCYAVQDKVWATDPEGMRWEWYKVLENSDTFSEPEPEPEPKPAPPSTCC